MISNDGSLQQHLGNGQHLASALKGELGRMFRRRSRSVGKKALPRRRRSQDRPHTRRGHRGQADAGPAPPAHRGSSSAPMRQSWSAVIADFPRSRRGDDQSDADPQVLHKNRIGLHVNSQGGIAVRQPSGAHRRGNAAPSTTAATNAFGARPRSA
ncbi:hypothetical protein ACRAWD_09325 [Caulobacter segnis]